MSEDCASRNVITLYDRNAETWAAARGTDLIERPWLDAFLSVLPGAGRDVLDLGCGTGQPIAAHLLDAGCHVTGIDGAPGMIARARSALPAGRWRVADMRDLPAELGRFHGLIAWHSLFHLSADDQRAVLSRIAAHAAPGAALMFTSGPAHGEALGSFAGETLYHASLDPAEYRALLHGQGFDVVRHTVRDASCGGATIWLATRRAV